MGSDTVDPLVYLGLKKPSTRAHSLERRKSQGPQATVKQSLIDINVVEQESLKGTPKISQIPP